MKKSYFNRIIGYLPYYLRKKTNRKIVVIESDDWGQERATNKDAINWAEWKYGKDNFTRWTTDSLETIEDLKLLFDLLNSFQNSFQNNPIITANFITHNIDYKNSSTLTFKSIAETNPALHQMYLTGMNQNILRPQLHGFCHYNLSQVYNYFNSIEGKEEFENNFFFAKTTIKGNLSTLEGECATSNLNYEAQLISAQRVFNETFGFYSETFVPPRFIIDSKIIKLLSKNKIKCMQGGNRLVNANKQKYLVPFYRKHLNQIWLNRNCRLDPHIDYNYNSGQCIDSINWAFKNQQPAVIDFHRVNLSGNFTPEYRDKSLHELAKVLTYLKVNHPDTLFISSDNLHKYF